MAMVHHQVQHLPEVTKPVVAKHEGDITVVVEEDPSMRRTAGWLDVLYHSITSMVGAGVLGLPAVFSYLGWGGGIIMLIFSFWVSWYTYKLLCYMHEVPDLSSKHGIKRLDRYDQLMDYVFGKGAGKKYLLPFQCAVLIGVPITYVVVGGNSLHAFAELINPAAAVPKFAYYIIFGGLQLLLSLVPSFNELSLVSLVGAIMSVCYCTIAVAMSATVNPTPGSVNYDPMRNERSSLEMAMGVFNAMTSVLFAYGGHNIALEIQATLPINERHTSSLPRMMKGVNITFVITGIAYFAVSIVGFWAFGTNITDNVLLSFAKGPHSWVVAMADMMVLVHVASAWQVYIQPIYHLMETRIQQSTGVERLNPIIPTSLRMVMVVACTVVAIIIPFFGSLMGLIGAIAVTPTTFLLPPLLWLSFKKPSKFGWEWWINWFLVIITGVIGLLGTVGAIYGIVAASSTYKIFAS